MRRVTNTSEFTYQSQEPQRNTFFKEMFHQGRSAAKYKTPPFMCRDLTRDLHSMRRIEF